MYLNIRCQIVEITKQNIELPCFDKSPNLMSTQQYPLQLDINALKLYAQTQIVSILEQIMLAAVAYAVLCLCIYRVIMNESE